MKLLNNEISRFPLDLVIEPVPAGHSMHLKLHKMVGSTVATAGYPKTTGLCDKTDKKYEIFRIR